MFKSTLLFAATALPIVGCAPPELDNDGTLHVQNVLSDYEPPANSGISTPSDAGEPSIYGPDNSWFHANTADVPEISNTGFGQGDIAPNFTLEDQFGDTVELYQFFGQVVVLDIFAQWCGPCQDAAPEGQHIWETYEADGLIYLAIMEDANNGPPTIDSLNEWVEDYNLTHPVLADPGLTQDPFVLIGYPTFVVLDREMKVVEPDLWPVSETTIASYL